MLLVLIELYQGSQKQHQLKYNQNYDSNYKDRNVIFITATNDKLKKTKVFLNNNEFLFQQVCGKEGKKIMKLFDNNGLVRIYPRHFIISKNENIVSSAIGSCSTIHSLIETQLKEL